MMINALNPTEAEAMTVAVARVRESLKPVTALNPADFVADGILRVRAATEAYANGSRLGDEAAVRLGMALLVLRVRDEAWTLIDDRACHLVLWEDLTRRLEPEPGCVAPAATLLATAAWNCGDTRLARSALRRALAAKPDYTMALLIQMAMDRNLPHASFAERMPTSEDLDQEMGPARQMWLSPLAILLG